MSLFAPKSVSIPKTVDDVMARYAEDITNLERIREANLHMADNFEISMNMLKADIKDALSEAERASKAIENINSLLIGL